MAANGVSPRERQLEQVLAAPPTRKTLVATTSQPARVEAFEVTPLFAKLAGYVGEVHVDIGDLVKKDQLLVSLRIPELSDDVRQKRAMLEQAKAEIAQADANVEAMQAAAETAQAHIAEAIATVSRAEADRQRWSAELDRMQQLAQGGSVTQKLVDETRSQELAARAAKEAAEASVQSAKAAAREAKAKVAKAEADRAAAKARLEVAVADLAHAETMKAYAEIKAPFDGVVTQRSTDTGHFVQPGTGSPLLVVARTDKVRVILDVPEMEASMVENGDPVTLTVSALGGKKLNARVTRTSWSLDSINRTLRTEADVANDASAMRPGMYATGVIELDRRENVLTLPLRAVVREAGGGAFCFRVVDGMAVRTPVELGLRSGGDVEIMDGLGEQDVVVLNKADSLTDGQAVKVIQTR